jgi:hypothetical protein
MIQLYFPSGIRFKRAFWQQYLDYTCFASKASKSALAAIAE